MLMVVAGDNEGGDGDAIFLKCRQYVRDQVPSEGRRHTRDPQCLHRGERQWPVREHGAYDVWAGNVHRGTIDTFDDHPEGTACPTCTEVEAAS